MDPKKMKKVGLEMNILMGVTLSFCLSLIGTLSSGHFTVPGFLISFAISTVLSLIIGFIVPMKSVNDKLERKHGLVPGAMKTKLIESLISDCIYTPIMTLSMTLFAFMQMKKQAAHNPHMELPPYPIMFLRSLLISMVAGYVIIFIVTPIFMKLVLKKNGMMGPGGPGGPNAPGGPERPE